MLPEAPEPHPPITDGSCDRLTRARALGEVFLCSGYPTQFAAAGILAAVGIRPASATLSPTYVFAISAVDTCLLIPLVFYFLTLSKERPRDVFLGPRPAASEIAFGILTVPVLLMAVVALQIGVRWLAPSLHNVETSPFMPLLESPGLLAGFIVLLVVAGGVREELQRAFLLHRFEQRLGGGRVGLVVASVAFGLGHTLQGWDAALMTALLGAFWGAIYLARRGVAATIASHAIFNVAQVLIGYVNEA